MTSFMQINGQRRPWQVKETERPTCRPCAPQGDKHEAAGKQGNPAYTPF